MSAVIFLPPGGGRSYRIGGMQGIFKVDADEAEGRQCFSEWVLDAGDAGPPPHFHREHQEAFFVLEGTLTFRAGDRTFESPPGSFLLIPPGTVHTFSNGSEARAKCINVWLPGGFEESFAAFADAVERGEQLDPAEIARMSAESDTYFEDG
jgi:mannose-6-phosphate isomerase-like protein (cupin superfamily)